MKDQELDNQFRERLKDRRIMPSEAAWDRLQAQLDQKGEVSASLVSQWSWRWAAAVVPFLLAGGLLWYFNAEVKTGAVQVVPTEVVVQGQEEKGDARVQEPVIQSEITSGTSVVTAEGSRSEVSREERVKTGKQPLENALAVSEPVTTDQNLPEIREEDPEVLAVALSLAQQQDLDQLSDEEVDALLMEAIKRHRAPRAIPGKVDASDLLADVESELDQNFKDKVLETLQLGIVKIRSAVAERRP